MKKIMVALAIVAMAACSHGAMVYWQFTEGVNSSYIAEAQDLTGYTAYLMVASDWNSEDVAASLDKAQASASFSTEKFTASVGQFQTGALKATGLDLTVGTGTFKIILSNGESYWASDDLANVSILADGDISTTYTAAKIQLANAAAIKTSDMQAIPEPTSGILLMLGLAGLALKRKRA